MKKHLALTAATAVAMLTAGACTSSTDSSTPTSQPVARPNLQLASALVRFDSCDSVMTSIRTEAGKRVTAYGLRSADEVTGSGGTGPDVLTPMPATAPGGGPPTTMAGRAGTATDGDAARESKASDGSPDPAAPQPKDEGESQGGDGAAPAHSSTNVQEVGVDEPDLIKTDGKHLYTLTSNTLRSFNIVDNIPRPAGTLQLRSSSGEQQLLMSGNKLLVLTKGVVGTMDRSSGAGRPGIPVPEDAEEAPIATVGTELVEVDASDPTQMKQTSQITIDGSVVDARLVGSTARVVVESTPGAIDFVRPTSSSRRAQESAKNANLRIVDASTSDDWLPHYSIKGSSERRPLVECSGVSHPKEFSGFGMVSVLTVEIGKGINPRNSVAVQADADKVYATTDRLFVSTSGAPEVEDTATSGSSSSRATTATARSTDTTRPGIDCDPACPPPEPIPPSTRVVPKPTVRQYSTAIHEFDITGSGPATYRASGDVQGHIMNDFAMSARDGFLRVASTDGPRGARSGTESYVTVLQEQDGELRQVGKVGGMGRGEQIKSVRFIGSVGYVVTFRQTDPLYTVELSDPRDPKVVGELKILGYSAYLHPIAPGRLLGVGQDATDRGRTLGTQVSLFDVSNPADPKELQKVTLPNASSDAESDYHAFMWWDPARLAIIPVQSAGVMVEGPAPCPPDSDCSTMGRAPTRPPFVGAVGFTVGEDGIRELGQIVNPSVSSRVSPCPPDLDCTSPGPDERMCATPEGCGSSPDDGEDVAGTPPSSNTIMCVRAPCPDEPTPIPPVTSTTSTTNTTTSSTTSSSTTSPSTTAPSTTSSSTTSPSTTSPPSSTTSTTRPDGCDPMCPVPVITMSGAPIERAVVVGDRVYTLSVNGLLVSELSTLKPMGWVPFT